LGGWGPGSDEESIQEVDYSQRVLGENFESDSEDNVTPAMTKQ
jgi:hypothetical protein